MNHSDALNQIVDEIDARAAALTDLLGAGGPSFEEEDPEVEEFIRLTRAGEPAPLDLTTRLAAKGVDVDALEAAITL